MLLIKKDLSVFHSSCFVFSSVSKKKVVVFFFNISINISMIFVETGSDNFMREERILERIYRLSIGFVGLLRNKWVSLDMNSVIIKDSLNPIMFILYLEARMMACEHMQQLHRASTGLESPGHCDSSIPRLERNRNDGSRALFVFHCKHQERCYVFR